MNESTPEITAAALLIVSLAVLGAMAAAGIVLGIKIARRRRAAPDADNDAVDVTVPAVPMSSLQAQYWMRRYTVAAAAILVVLLVAAVVVLSWSAA